MSMNKFTTEQKTNIILDYLGNKMSINGVCAKYSISQSYFLKLKNKFLQNAHKALESEVSDNNQLSKLKQELDDTRLALAESQTALSILKKKTGY